MHSQATVDATTATSCPWSPEAQRARFGALAARIRRRLRPLLAEDATGEDLIWWDQDRVALWAAHAFFAGDAEDAAFGNTIVRYVRDRLQPKPGPNVFTAAASASLLAETADGLTDDVREYLDELLRSIAPFGTTGDFQFHGYNDNMPVMWTWALAFAGERYDEPAWRRVAWANLCQLRDLLRRRGTVAEYGAGYATHRLTGLAPIAEHCASAELRELACDAEGRLWAEHAGHWHPGLGVLGGGSMRGGPPLNAEHAVLLSHVLGPAAAPAWVDLPAFLDGRETVVELGRDPARHVFAYPPAYAAEFASAEYHVPAQVAPLFFEKRPGFTFRCTAENGYVNEGLFCKQVPVYGHGGVLITTRLTNEEVCIPDYPEHGAQPHGLTTHHGRHFVLGTSTTNMFRTSHALRCTYRRTPDARCRADLGDLYVRYNINAKVPGGRLPNRYYKSREHHDDRENYCTHYHDCGRHACLQHGTTAMVLSTPCYLEHWDLREMRTDVMILQQYGRVRQVYADGQPIASLPYASPMPVRIDLDEGAVYLSLHPLIGRHGQRDAAVTIREINEHLVISFYNYAGPSMALDKHGIAKLGGGFVLEVRDAEDVGPFAEFQRRMGEARVLDALYGGRRRVHYATPEVRLSTHHCPYTATTMHASINGLERSIPQLQLDAHGTADLPWIGEPAAPGFDDWAWLETQMTRPIEDYNPRE